MTKVVWFFPDETSRTSHIQNMTDFLDTLQRIDLITHDGDEYEVLQTELVIEEEPWVAVALK